jgi:hypothetical protein
LQSTLVDFPYLRDVWRANTSEERLLLLLRAVHWLNSRTCVMCGATPLDTCMMLLLLLPAVHAGGFPLPA